MIGSCDAWRFDGTAERARRSMLCCARIAFIPVALANLRQEQLQDQTIGLIAPQ